MSKSLKTIYSFWPQAETGEGFCGYRNKEEFLDSAELSVRLAYTSVTPDVTVYTTPEGEKVLEERLRGLVTFEGIELTEKCRRFFSLSKLLAYLQQDTPFLHVDFDVFLWDRPKVCEGVFAQSWESFANFEFYRGGIEYLGRLGKGLPSIWREAVEQSESIGKAINAGIFGGTDVAFIRNCAKQILGLVKNHGETLFKHDGWMTIVLEQYFPVFYARKCNVPFSVYLTSDAQAHNPGTRYTHAMSSIKRFSPTPEQVKEKLRVVRAKRFGIREAA